MFERMSSDMVGGRGSFGVSFDYANQIVCYETHERHGCMYVGLIVPQI